jgi:hypothetical protein
MLSTKLSTKRKPSTRKRAPSHAPHYQSQESHDNALAAIRSFLKCHTVYDAFPVSFRLIVLDTKLNVKKALQCLLLNGMFFSLLIYHLIVSRSKVSYQHPYGTVKSQSLPACSRYWTSYISSNTTTAQLPTIMLRQMSKLSAWNPCEVIL